jgi:hypothetical protein
MVLEQLINTKWLQRRPLYAVVLGFIYTLIGSITGFILFRQNFSISLLFLITLLLVPSLMNLLNIGEKREKIDGPKKLYRDHKDIFEIYLFLSLGVFIGYLVMIWFLTSTGVDLNLTLSEQLNVLGDSVTKSQIEQFNAHKFTQWFNILSSNVGVAVIFFILSFFYGAGSIFLIVWNASIFSAFIFTTLRNISQGINHGIAILGAFSIYMVPEIAGFLLAAIAGGAVSKAAVTEDFMSEEFRSVLKDALQLLFVSFAVLFISAFLETFVAVNLIKAMV